MDFWKLASFDVVADSCFVVRPGTGRQHPQPEMTAAGGAKSIHHLLHETGAEKTASTITTDTAILSRTTVARHPGRGGHQGVTGGTRRTDTKRFGY